MRRLGTLLFAVGLVLYLATAKPDLIGDDPGEFQFVSWVLGIAHHTGYPLYTMLGWLWAQALPVGSVAYRMNLLSALCGAAAVALAGLLAARLAGPRLAPLGAVVAAAALMVAPLHWQWATVAGVRAGAVAEVGWLLLAAAGVLAAAGDPERRRALPGAVVVLALSAGVALAHHRSGALVLPGIALAVASCPAVWRLPPRAWALAVAAGVAPLLTYAYLPVRGAQHPPFHQWRPETWDGFVDLALALEHSRVHFIFPLEAMPGRAEMLLAHLRGEFGLLGVGLAAVGAFWLLARRPRAGLVLAAYFLIQSWQVLNWDVGLDRLNVVYQLPAHLVMAVWLALGVTGPLGWLPWRVGRVAAPLLGAVLLVWIGARGLSELAAQRERAIRPINHDREDLAEGWHARRIVGGGLERVEPNAVVVGDWEQATVVWYLQLVEERKPGVQVTYTVASLPYTLEDYPDRPVWLMARTAPPPDRRLSADGPFVRVAPGDRAATAPPPDVVPTSLRFGDVLELAGYGLHDRRGGRVLEVDRTGDVLPVTLYWRALGAARPDVSVSVRLVAPDGRIAAQQDAAHPVLSLYPTSRWREGEVVGDYYELPYRGLPPGEYRLELRVYRVDGGFRDLLVDGRDHATLQAVPR